MVSGSLSSSEADSENAGVIGLAILFALYLVLHEGFWLEVKAFVLVDIDFYGSSFTFLLVANSPVQEQLCCDNVGVVKDLLRGTSIGIIHVVLYQCIVRTVITIVHIVPLQALVDDPLNQLPLCCYAFDCRLWKLQLELS
ncbi:hypothetical protein Tco_1107768 [Tanacetum coccineum]